MNTSSTRTFSILTLGLALAAGPVVFAQTAPAVAVPAAAPAAPLQFDVVSLKPSDPKPAPGTFRQLGVQLTADTLTMNYDALRGLICIAYNIPAWEVSGGEPWMGRELTDPRDHFDLVAKMPTDLGPYDQRHGNFDIGDARIREMMQTMLADRFHLKFHRETTTGTVSILEQSGKPVLLTTTTLRYAKNYGDGYSEVGGAVEGRGVSLYNTSMPQLAKFLSESILHHPVIDKTGLDGRYDFRSKTIVTKEDFESGNVTNLYLPAVSEMGLKLTTAKGPVESFVIDHAEPPSPN